MRRPSCVDIPTTPLFFALFSSLLSLLFSALFINTAIGHAHSFLSVQRLTPFLFLPSLWLWLTPRLTNPLSLFLSSKESLWPVQRKTIHDSHLDLLAQVCFRILSINRSQLHGPIFPTQSLFSQHSKPYETRPA